MYVYMYVCMYMYMYYHCKKEKPDSQALRVNRICSDNENFDNRCNNFGKMTNGKSLYQENDMQPNNIEPVHI